MSPRERIRILRLLNGLTQDNLSKKSGCPRGSITAWELGTCYPNRSAAPKLAKILGVSSGYIIYGDHPPHAGFWNLGNREARHVPMIKLSLSGLLLGLLNEVEITQCARYIGNDGDIYFMGRRHGHLTFILVATGKLCGSIEPILAEACTVREIISDKIPPVSVATIDEANLGFFFKLARQTGLEIDESTITSLHLAQKSRLDAKIDWPDWRQVDDAPIKERILTVSVSGHIQCNSLQPGHGSRQDPSMYYWERSDDFDDITHWMPCPPLPQSFSDDLNIPLK